MFSPFLDIKFKLTAAKLMKKLLMNQHSLNIKLVDELLKLDLVKLDLDLTLLLELEII